MLFNPMLFNQLTFSISSVRQVVLTPLVLVCFLVTGVLLTSTGVAQAQVPQNVITTEAIEAQSVYAADLTDDGNMDVLSASSDKIAWYENGGGFFSDQKVITTDVGSPFSVHAADLTGNGDMDIFSADGLASADIQIAWYENNDFGSFSDQQVITNEVFGGTSVHAADLTGDGNMDVLSASSGDDTVAWYENTDDVLPVELTYLSVHANGTGARLTWQTASETNNSGFYIQHQSPSVDGDSPAGSSADRNPSGDWERLGFVQGAETTSSATSYQFTVEKELSLGTHWFRLRQVDTDGTAYLSDPVSLQVQMWKKIRLSAPAPNPTTEKIRLSFAVKESDDTTVRLYNLLGQRVATLYQGQPAAKEQHRLSLDTSGLTSGTYVIRLQAGGTAKTRKVTVVR